MAVDTLLMKEVNEIKFETEGADYGALVYAIHTKNNGVIYATALINEDFDVIIKCDMKLSEEIENNIYNEAIKVWKERLNEND